MPGRTRRDDAAPHPAHAGGREGATRGAARPTPGHRGSPDWHLRSGIETAQAHDTDVVGSRVRTLLSEHGGVDALAAQCETVSAWHRNNDLPLLWSIHARHRALLFRLIDLLDIRPATQDCRLLNAWTVVSTHRHARRSGIQGDIDLSFASQRWRSFMVRRGRRSPSTGVR